MSDPLPFAQLKLAFIDPIQHDYEVIRPLVLWGDTVTARSDATGLDRATVGDKARRFVVGGMLALADQRATHAGRKPHPFPDTVASYILYLKQLYPPMHYREIVRILQRKFGYTTNHSTVKRFLHKHPLPVQLPLEWTTFHQFADAYRARWTVVRMWAEGWNKKSIAACLRLSRSHVHTVIAAFEQDGFAGLEDQRTRPVHHPQNQLTLPLFKDILDLQHIYPQAGRARIHGLLEHRYQEAERSDDLPSERTVGRALAHNRQWHAAPRPPAASATPPTQTQPLPYTPQYRHQYWFIDLRYWHRVDGQWMYSLCVLEGYSRKILAGMASAHQDLVAVLQILTAALTTYGCPAGMVSDNGAVFTAHGYQAVLEALGIARCYIDKGQPWQNLLEAQFRVQSRLADAQVAQATSADEVQHIHAAWIETFNTTRHWAHRERADGQYTPADVLGWVRGQPVDTATIHTALQALAVERTVDQRGYVRVQRFYLYAERGLARQRIAIWFYEGRLHFMYREALLARYRYRAHQQRHQLRTITHPVHYRTTYTSPQLELWELDDTQWRKVIEHPRRHARRQKPSDSPWTQLPLPLVGLIITVVLFVWAIVPKP